MEWKLSGSSPVYLQIMAHIRHAVLTGEYPPGARIPPVRELAEEARVNPNTMQRALMTLEQEKILVCPGTAGRFVTDDREILDKLRKKERETVIKSCAMQLKAVGLSLTEAAEIFSEWEGETAWKPY